MLRYAFRLRVKADRIADYDEAHRRVWPDLLAVIKAAGISEYSIFRRDTELFFTLRCDDFDHSWSVVEASDANALWQAEMTPLFGPPDKTEPGERFPMMVEVFYLE